MSKYNRCFIAEKKSLGTEVAEALGKQKGIKPTAIGASHFIIGDDVVSWFRGHVYEQAKPDAYGFKFGDLGNMPVVVPNDKWQMNIKEDERDWYKNQVKIIKELVSDSNEIVNVGDAGREGQLLIDEGLDQWKIDPYGSQVKRMWIKSLTSQGLQDALNHLENNEKYKTLGDSALGRARADWMHGMTMTGMFTSFVRKAGGNNLISIGRVQTVILRIIVDRDLERLHFVPVDYFKPFILGTHANGDFSASWQYNKEEYKDGLITDKAVIDDLLARVSGKSGTVKSFSSTPKSEGPPLTFSLSTLNVFCAKRFGMTSDRVLEIAQSLYDKKITSYPRTDSEYLNNDQHAEAPTILDCIKDIPGLGPICANANTSLRSKVWNSSKVTDHYAIVPTEEASLQKYNGLEPDERKVFDIIAKQYLAQFYPERKWNALNAIIACGEDTFKANGNQPVSPGWKVVFDGIPDEDDEDKVISEDDDKATLPAMSIGDSVTINKLEYGADKTKKPSILNDGTLEEFLNKPYLLEKDPEIRKKIKETDGIGRTSTRPPIIKILLQRGYIIRGKKKKTELESTPLGRSLIQVLPEEIKAIGMTAIWEGFLDQIKDGKITLEKFLDATKRDLENKSKNFIERYGNTGLKLAGMTGEDVNVKPLPGDGEKCPECGKGIMKTHRRFSQKANKHFTALFCENQDGSRGCGKILFPDTSPPVKPLPGEGKECPNCHEGHLKTKKLYSQKLKKDFIALVCEKTGGQRGCGHMQFPNPNESLKKIDGDGNTCDKCNKGIMKTWKITSQKTKKDYIVLSCRDSGDFNKKGCGNMVFPETPKKK